MVCIVTGSSRGLGKAIAVLLGKRGAKVAVHYRERKQDAEKVAQGIADSITVRADVRNAAEIRSLVDSVVARWGRVDLLVNNAGMSGESLLLKTDVQDFQKIIETNLSGPFYFIRCVAGHMVKEKKGHIINVSSYAGVKGRAGLSAYAASKAGIIGLTRTAAQELGSYNIMVNAVLPGYVMTDMGATAHEKARTLAREESVLNRFSEGETVAEFIWYLSRTGGVSGQVFNLDSRIV